MKPRLTFCSVLFPGPRSEISTLLLVESIRAFGGSLARQPIWVFMPDYGEPMTGAARKRLQALDVEVRPFPIDQEELRFFFMGHLRGLALAEEANAGDADVLAWLDANTVLLREPNELLLPAGKSFGYRPVHHLLLGSRFDQPLDPFWTQVYRSCQVPPERVFAMRPVVEDLQMRPYFNAGFLITRPERGLFRQWHATFRDLCDDPLFRPFYEQDSRYNIFMHQALLSGVALRHLEPEEMLDLPETYNYPVHLYEQDATGRRPASMDELVTFRHEGFYRDAGWVQEFPASDALKRWLSEQLMGVNHE